VSFQIEMSSEINNSETDARFPNSKISIAVIRRVLKTAVWRARISSHRFMGRNEASLGWKTQSIMYDQEKVDNNSCDLSNDSCLILIVCLPNSDCLFETSYCIRPCNFSTHISGVSPDIDEREKILVY